MKRLGTLTSAGFRVVSVLGLALLIGAAPRAVAAQAQQAATPPPQEDPLKLTATTPIMLINQIKADRAADFEQAWASIRTALAKAEKPEIKAFGETLSKMFKVDLPPGGGAVIYIFQIDLPSTTISYNPGKVVYETLHAQGGMTREDADAIYKKLDGAYQSINPWPLVKIG